MTEPALLDRLEEMIREVKRQVLEKQALLQYFEKELSRMHTIFVKVVKKEAERKQQEKEVLTHDEVALFSQILASLILVILDLMRRKLRKRPGK